MLPKLETFHQRIEVLGYIMEYGLVVFFPVPYDPFPPDMTGSDDSIFSDDVHLIFR